MKIVVPVLLLLGLLSTWISHLDTSTTVEAQSIVDAANAAAAVTPPPSPSPQLITFKLKEDAKAGTFVYNASDVRVSSELKTSYTRIKTEDQFVVVKLKITNKDKRARDISAHAFELLDSAGTEYEAYNPLASVGGDEVLFYETINPGLSRTRLVVFETPKGISGLKLQAKSGVMLAGDEITQIDLGQ